MQTPNVTSYSKVEALKPDILARTEELKKIPKAGIKDPKKDNQTKTTTSDKENKKAEIGSRINAIFRVKIGTKEFSSLKGEIIPPAYVRLSTYQHSTVKFTLNDPEDKIRQEIKDEQDIEVEVGFANGETQNIFVGKIFSIGKVPDGKIEKGKQVSGGTIIEGVDPAYQLQSQVGSSVQYSSQTDAPATSTAPTDGKVLQTLTGNASYYGKGFAGRKTASGEIFDPSQMTAAHKTLPFKTQIRVTNLANNQSVTVRVTDRGPYSGDRILDLSEGAAKQIGMIQTGTAKVKIEVLGQGSATNTPQTASNQPTQGAAGALVATPPKPDNRPNSKPAPTSGNEVDLVTQINEASLAASKGETRGSALELFTANNTDLKIASDTKFNVSKAGTIQLQQSVMGAMVEEALRQGDVIVTRGNTVRQVGPGQAEPSGIILDIAERRAAIIGKLTVTKRSGIQLQSAYGSLTVQGWSVSDKTMVGATIVTPSAPGQHPTGIIQAPQWGTIKLKDPIYPGSAYTWGDATKNGRMVPHDASVMQGIVDIARWLDIWTKEIGKDKLVVTSWYRTPAHNASVGGASGSYHMRGCAIDMYFPGYIEWFNKMKPTWKGGIAWSNGRCGRFVHVDTGPSRPSWKYP